MGINTTLIKAIESTYTHCQEQIRIGGYTSTPYSLLSGLRQGSVLSPILFVLYTSSLLDQLSNAPHGIPISSDIFDLICALMFVDDLFTISTTLLGTTTHLVTNWALKHHAVLSFEKSSISTANLSEEQISELANTITTLKHKKSIVYLGVLINLKQLLAGYSGVGQDVAHRTSQAEKMIRTMNKRGLKKGAVALLPGLHIIRTTALACITYGLSAPFLTEEDTYKLDTTIANAIAHILRIPTPLTKGQTEWLLHDTGMVPPTVQIHINDCTAHIKACLGQTDPITSSLLPHDTDLTNSVNAFLLSIGTTRMQVTSVKPHNRTEFLTARYRSAKTNSLPPHTSPLTHSPLPILHRTLHLSPEQQSALITARHNHCFPSLTTCTNCNQATPSINTHKIWDCIALATPNPQNLGLHRVGPGPRPSYLGPGIQPGTRHDPQRPQANRVTFLNPSANLRPPHLGLRPQALTCTPLGKNTAPVPPATAQGHQ